MIKTTFEQRIKFYLDQQKKRRKKATETA